MKKFDIKLVCGAIGCKSDKFKIHDTIKTNEDLFSLAAKIASDGIVNLSAFQKTCVLCGNSETLKLIYKEHENNNSKKKING